MDREKLIETLKAKQAELAELEEKRKAGEESGEWSDEDSANFKRSVEATEEAQKAVDDFDAEAEKEAEKQATARAEADAKAKAELEERVKRVMGYSPSPTSRHSGGSGNQLVSDDEAMHQIVQWAQHGILPDGSYANEVNLFMGSTDDRDIRQTEFARALNVGAATAVGTLTVPGQEVRPILETLYETDPLRRAGATVVNTAGIGGIPIRLPTLGRPAADPDSNMRIAEAAASKEINPRVGSSVLGAATYRGFYDFSDELSEDEAAGLLRGLPSFMSNYVQALRGTDHMSSTDMGILPDIPTTSTVETATSTAITAQDIWNAKAHLSSPYKMGAQWMMSNTLWEGTVRNLVVGNERPFANGIDGQMPILSDEMDTTVAASNNVALYGQFSHYHIRDVNIMRLQRDPFSRAGNGQIRVWFRSRGGGIWVQVFAVSMVKLIGKA